MDKSSGESLSHLPSSMEPLTNPVAYTRGVWCRLGFLMLVASTAALTAFQFGFVIGNINVPQRVFSHCQELLSHNDAPTSSFFHLPGCFTVSPAMWGLVGAGVPLGGWIGSLAGSTILRHCGLRRSILLLNLPFLAGYLLMGLATSLPMLVAGRLLQGFSSGASGMIVPVYLASMAPLQRRGLITCFYQLFLVTGIMVAELVSYHGNLGRHLGRWRWGFGGGVVVCVLQGALALARLLPDPPSVLDAAGRSAQAALLRERLGFTASDEATPLRSDKPATSAEDMAHESTATTESILQLATFQIPRANRSLLLGLVLHAGQQLSGVNAVFFYSSLILAQNTTPLDGPPSFTPTLLAIVNAAVTVVAIWLLDRAGRRPIVLVSTAGASATLLLLAVAFNLVPPLAAPLLIAFVVAFALGLGPVPWLVAPEIFPAKWPLTPVAVSLCVSVNWLANCLITGTFPLLADRIPANYLFAAFGVLCFLLLLALHPLMPETRNRVANFICRD